MARKRIIWKGLAIPLAGVAGLLCAIAATAGPAHAYGLIVRTLSGSPTPTCPSGYVFNQTTGKCDTSPAPQCPAGYSYNTATKRCDALAPKGTPPALPSGGTTVVESLNEAAQAASASKSQVQIHVLAYDMANGMSKAAVSQAAAAGRCMVIGDGTKIPGFWNSGKDASGKIFWFWDTRTTKVCNFGGVWRKVGPRNCGNLVRFTVPKHVLKGVIVLVRSFGRFHATVTAHASAEAHASCGSASASATGTATVSGSTRQEAKDNAKLLASVKAIVSASASATAEVTCASPPTVTVTTPTTTTTVITTTTPTTTTTPVQHSCTLVVALASKSDPYTATASVGCDTTPSSVTIFWGDGTSSVGPAGASHTYAVPPASGTPGTGVTYTISATASFSNWTSAGTNQVQFFVPAPPPPQTVTQTTTQNGTTTVVTTTTTTSGPPPLPGG